MKEKALEKSVEILGNNQHRPLWFTLACSNKSAGNAMEMANYYYETGLFVNAEPDIMIPDLSHSIKEDTPCVNDSAFSSQWNLHNTGQNNGVAGIDIDYCNARQITQGDSNVLIAVIDFGFDMHHPDIINVFPLSYDAMSNSSPAQVYDPHGTACAGIIGAEADNEIGVAGIAPLCPLISLSCKLNLNVDISQKLANSIDFAWKHGASVISNSWGHNSLPQGQINDAISNAVTFGRDGKGCVVVFAAGNSNFSTVEYPASNPNVISVGAVDRCGKRSGRSDSGSGSCEYWSGYTTTKGSSYGNGLCVVAPGTHIPTTDRSGYPGYSFSGYFEFFNGTSSACPHVSAIAGLVLSVNSCLTYTEVRAIIESTCTKIRTDAYEYDTLTHPNNPWNDQLGYGLVNAYQAVLLAQQIGGYSQAYTSDIHINDNTIWSDNKLIKKHVVIDSGAVLTVTSTIHCSDSTCLIVRPGGKLVVDGGVLTSACPIEMWQGIEVVGDRTKHQTASFQGVVELKNGAIIENAHCAIKTGLGEDNWHTTGGIIKASNTTFRNNRRAVAFLSYVDTAASGALRSNYSYFRNCTFAVDENNVFAQNNGEFIDHITMWQVKGVNFYSCHFSNTAAMNDRKHAIYTEDAGFSVSKYCPITQPDCPCEIVESLRNTFTGFNIAIDVNTTGDQFPVTIDHSKFINNATGIRINGNHFVTITRNDFDLQDIPTSGITNIGLLMYNSTGYKVEGNRFHRAVTNPYITPCGILMEQSGTENNNIYLNSFDTLYEGLYISGINGDVSGGLQMTCNEFLGNRYDIYMTSSAVVSPWQGHSGKGADNIFDNHSTYNLYNCGTQYITYFYSNNSSFYPAHVTSNVMRVGGASTNPRTPTFCNIGGGVPIGGGGIKSKSGFQSDVDDYLSALTNSVDEMDNENNSDSSPESLRNMRHALSNTYYENVRKLMADTLLSLSELEQWHTIAQPIADPYSLTETKFQNGNPNSTVIAEALEETNNYADFHALKTLCGAGGSGINWYELTDSQIEQLQSIAELNTGRTSVMAKGILCFFFGICYEDDWSIEVASETRSAKATPNNNETSSLFVYPNLTDNTLYVELLGSVIDNVILYDLQGRIVDCKLSLEDGITTVGIGNIPAGVYLVYVTDENGNSYYQKIIKK